VIAMIMPATTKTMIAICIQIQVGDMTLDSVPAVRHTTPLPPHGPRTPIRSSDPA
jgi:hypothetical protein